VNAETRAGNRPLSLNDFRRDTKLSAQASPETIYPGNLILSTSSKTIPGNEMTSKMKEEVPSLGGLGF